MKNKFLKLSLQKQLLIYFIFVIFMCAFIFTAFNQLVTYKALVETTGENQYLVVSNQVDNINKRMEEIDSYIMWICINKDLKELLMHSENDISNFHEVRKRLYNDFDNIIMSFPNSNLISTLYIKGTNGFEFRKGEFAYSSNISDYEKDKWYETAQKSNGETLFFPVINNYNVLPTNYPMPNMKNVIPIFKYIKSTDSANIVGELTFLISSDVYFDIYHDTDKSFFNETSILIDKNGVVISSTEPSILNSNKNFKSFADELKKGKGNGKYFNIDYEGKNYFVVYREVDSLGYYLLRVFPSSKMSDETYNIFLLGFLILGATVLFSSFLAVMLTKNFTRPINEIIYKTSEIAKGNFGYKVNLKTENELEELNENLEIMEQDLQKLLLSRIQKEKEKNHLQLKMLQNQIAPHFVFNTLNAIQWMAEIQGSDGIFKASKALGNILYNTIKNKSEFITIKEELGILDDYMYIQNIRYRGKIKFNLEIKEDSILLGKIPKLSLQPLVENSIFHGLQPKKGTGQIDLTLEKIGDDIFVTLIDDGIGIDKERLEKVEAAMRIQDNSSIGIGIGIVNVHRRIQLLFGEKYGLAIAETKPDFTKIEIIIPYMGANNDKATDC